MRIPSLLPLLLVPLLAGCGTFADPTSWLAGDDVIEPTKLVDLDNRIAPSVAWSRRVGVGTDGHHLSLRPALTAERVFVADAEGTVMALDRDSGAVAWALELDTPVSGGPGVGDGLVLLGTSEGEVIALGADEGALRWRSRAPSEVLSVPATFNGVVVAHTVDGKLVGLEATTGEERWRYEREVPVLSLRGLSSPVIVDGVIYLGLAGGKLVALRSDNGGLLWEATITIPGGRSELQRLADIDGDPLVVGGGVFAATYQGEVAAMERRSGRVAWRTSMSVYGTLAADTKNIYAADDEGRVHALDPRSGEIRWTQEALMHRRLSDVVALQETVVVGDFEGYLHWLAAEDGRLLARTRVGSEPITRGLVAADEMLYVYGDGGELAVLRVPGPR
jgi:outer membrane protein assembly factor BamB